MLHEVVGGRVECVYQPTNLGSCRMIRMQARRGRISHEENLSIAKKTALSNDLSLEKHL